MPVRMSAPVRAIHGRRTQGAAKWASGTAGSGANRLTFGFAGDLYVWNTRTGASAPWAIDYSGQCGSGYSPVMALQRDSNFVLYCYRDASYTPFWSTGTVF